LVISSNNVGAKRNDPYNTLILPPLRSSNQVNVWIILHVFIRKVGPYGGK